MKFLALVIAAQLATALPLAKEAACDGSDVLCQLTNPVQEQVDNAPVRSLNRRDEIEDALSGIDMSDMPEKGEPIPARPSKRDTVTPSAEDVSEAAPDVYQETYNMKPEVTEVTEESYDDVLPELSDSLSKRGLFDDLSLDKTLPEFQRCLRGCA